MTHSWLHQKSHSRATWRGTRSASPTGAELVHLAALLQLPLLVEVKVAEDVEEVTEDEERGEVVERPQVLPEGEVADDAHVAEDDGGHVGSGGHDQPGPRGAGGGGRDHDHAEGHAGQAVGDAGKLQDVFHVLKVAGRLGFEPGGEGEEAVEQAVRHADQDDPRAEGNATAALLSHFVSQPLAMTTP